MLINNKVRIYNQSQSILLFENGVVAKNFFHRLRGLMFYPKMPQFNALVITPCQSIHTFFMKFSLSVLVLDKENTVIDIIKRINPARFSRYYFSAHKFIEFPYSKNETINANIGDKIVLEYV